MQRKLRITNMVKFCTLMVIIIYIKTIPTNENVQIQPQEVDLVVTWVNGTEAGFAAEMRSYLRPPYSIQMQGKADAGEDNISNRFEDSEELRFAMRSIEKNLGWVRKVFLITNGQVPNWLDIHHPKVVVVPHEDFFENSSDLPTFSSVAIEANLHRIPGLSELFISTNDDVLFSKELGLDDFYDPDKGQKVWLNGDLPETGGLDRKHSSNLMVEFVNNVFDKEFGKRRRQRIGHGPVFLQKSVLEACHGDPRLEQHWRQTSAHRFRMPNDMPLRETYVYYLQEKRDENSENMYRFQVVSEVEIGFKRLESNFTEAALSFEDLKTKPHKFICINNNLDGKDAGTNELVRGLQLQYYEDLFPARSSFELPETANSAFSAKKRVSCVFSQVGDTENIKCMEK